MRVNLSELLPQTVTIINRLKSKDNDAGRDKFVKKILKDCIWQSVKLGHQNGKEVYYTKGIGVQIPKKQDYTYKPYSEWISDIANSYTLSLDDYIIKGEVAEDISAENISKIINKYSPFTCKISSINDYTSPENAISFSNNSYVMRYANIYYVEGE